MTVPKRERRPRPGTALENTRNDAANTSLKALRLQRIAGSIHALGARALYELLAELVAEHGGDVLLRAEVYAALDPDIVRALGGDRFAPSPLRTVA